MDSVHYQVEFYSDIESRWVPLFARERSESEAQKKAREWLPNAQSRVTRITQKTEVCWESEMTQGTAL